MPAITRAAPMIPAGARVSWPMLSPMRTAQMGSLPMSRLARDADVCRMAQVWTRKDLVDEEWVSVPEGFPLMPALQAIAVHVGRPLKVTHRINEFFIAASVVSAGPAVALMPRHTAPPVSGSGVVLKPIDDLPLARRIDLLCRPEALHRAAVQHVIRALREIATST